MRADDQLIEGCPPEIPVSGVGRETESASHPEQPFDPLERRLRRVALDLHDGPIQTLSAAAAMLHHAARSTTLESARIQVAATELLLERAGLELRDIVGEARPAALDAEEMTAKLLEYVEEFRDRWGFSIAFSVTGEEIPLTASQQIAVFRVVQEGLTNARKYSRASCIGVDIVYDRDEVTVRIDDDGVGLDATAGESHAGGGHRGIPGMRERLELVGGSFEIASGPHAGTHITVTLPAGRQ